MIKTIIFDFGGVIITLDQPQAIRRFQALGLADADKRLDAYTQCGIFGELEEGRITAEEFRIQLSALVGHEVSVDECRYAWVGYCKELPHRNLLKLKELRRRGYRLVLLSNTNPYMMSWADSADFDGSGHPVSDYFDALYKSYEVGVMKPDPQFFRHVLESERLIPAETLFVDDGPRNVAAAEALGFHTLCPANGADWTLSIEQTLSSLQ
jgi:putative hydrolase of the HAD superfamily